MAEPATPASPRRWRARLLLLVGVVVATGVAIELGLVGFARDPARVEEFLTGSGVVGPIAYVLAFTAAQPISLPGNALIIPATLVWPGPTVFFLSWLGGMIASTVGFVVARWVARDWVQDHLSEGLRSWDDRIASRGTRAIIALRVVTGYAPAADWLLGVSAVTFRQFLVGTAIGLVPTTAVGAFFGDDAIRLFARLPILFAVLIVAGVVVFLIRRRRRPGQDPGVASLLEGPSS